MSISVLHPATTAIQKHGFEYADRAAKRDDRSGYGQWLLWLQSLLKADTLILYRVDTFKVRQQIKVLACLPEVDSSIDAAYSQCAMRCAKKAGLIRAVSGSRANHSVVCLPDIGSSRKLVRHVLLIDRRSATGPDMQTQARLVAWAFQSLGKFSRHTTPSQRASPLLQWGLARTERSGTLPMVLAQLMDQLMNVTASQRCLVANLRMQGEVVRSASLVAVSGQRHIDNRLPASDSLVIAFEEVYCGKPIPLLVDNQPQAEPSVSAQTPVTVAQTLCARLLIPVYCAGRWFAVSLERSVEQPFGKSEQARLEHDLEMVIALLVLSDPESHSVTAACKRQIRVAQKRIRASIPRAFAISCVCVFALLYLLLPAEYRVSASLGVEASERHVLIAPVDGFVQSVAVKAGDSVKKGEVLASLDDLDLHLQQQKLQSEVRQNAQAYAKALALYDRVDVTRLKEEASRMQTELSQLELQRDRMVLVAPVDGVVLSGSWDDFLGAAVSSGDALFTLGSTSSHRLVLDVSEYDIKHVQVGQAVGIRMSADPSSVLQGTVTAIMPLAQASDGTNSVQVHAELNEHVPLRPGMQGLGKVLVGRQARLMQWLGRATARLVWLGWKLGVLK